VDGFDDEVTVVVVAGFCTDKLKDPLLVACAVSPPYEPPTACVPVPNAAGVYETEQVAIALLPLSVQLPDELNVPLPLLVKLTVPLGVTVVPESLSVTETVQLVALFTLTEFGKQLTEVEVVRLLTVSVCVPLVLAAYLGALEVSPSKSACIVWLPTESVDAL